MKTAPRTQPKGSHSQVLAIIHGREHLVLKDTALQPILPGELETGPSQQSQVQMRDEAGPEEVEVDREVDKIIGVLEPIVHIGLQIQIMK